VLLALAAARGAWAGEILDRVQRDGVVRCTAAERQAVAMPRPDGGIDGLAVDLCRAVAIAVLGRDGRVAFSLDAPPRNADVAFVGEASGAAAREQFVAGPLVFADRLAVLVPLASRLHSPRDLAGETVCLLIGSPEQSALEAAVGQLGIGIVRLAFEEDVEMRDAYAVGRCGAMVGAWSELSGMRGPMGINRLTSRLLPEPLAVVPIVAATSATDRDWAALVFFVVRAVVGDAAGPSHEPIAGTMTPAGVRPGWREDISAALGGYDAMLRRAGTGDAESSPARLGD
jgi:general L-amino acid transport system substrate-binding protein